MRRLGAQVLRALLGGAAIDYGKVLLPQIETDYELVHRAGEHMVLSAGKERRLDDERHLGGVVQARQGLAGKKVRTRGGKLQAVVAVLENQILRQHRLGQHRQQHAGEEGRKEPPRFDRS